MDKPSAWKNKPVVEAFVKGKRAAIPNASDQLNAMLHLLRYNEIPVKSFIDLGAGDGILSQLILEQFDDSKACLVDFSEPMIEAAYKRLEKYSHRIKIFKEDIGTPDWQQEVFIDDSSKVDVIVSGYCIHHLPHGRKYELYEEIYGRLSENGMFINIEHVASKSPWGEIVSEEAFIDSLLKYEEELPNPRSREEISREHYNREDKKENILLSPEVQCNWLREIGFKQVDVYFKSFELAVFAGKKL